MSILDSAAQLRSRAHELGLSQTAIDSLKTAGISTLGHLAFAAGANPTETTPDGIQNFVDSLGVTDEEKFILKRLIFEAQTLFIASLKAQVQSSGDGSKDPAKKLPPIERQSRIEAQRERLQGILIHGETEPSYELIDLCFAMIEEKVIKYIPPHRCTKRDTEIQDHSAKDKDILMLEKGQLVSKRNTLPSTSTSDALKLHNCLMRRALAFDISGLISFNKLHFYHQHLLSQLNMKPIPGFSQPLLNQVINADKSFWSKLSEIAEGDIVPHPDGSKPLDKLIDVAMHAPEVTFQLLPRPSAEADSGKGDKRYQPYPVPKGGKGKGKKGDKGEKGQKGKHKGDKSGKRSIAIPQALRGLPPRAQDGRYKCFDHNLPHGCPNPHDNCPKGAHICMKCEGRHSYQKCPQKDSSGKS